MDKGWFELESDPGLFTLLLEDFGATGVQVEEIYDLQKPIEGPVYGFIFLFKWIEERRSRRKIIQEDESFVVDEEIVNSMFFAQQVIPNSCATHALLSVLLNCDKLINIGDALLKLMNFTQGMNAEDKGFAIGNMPELARAHNSHARPELAKKPEHQKGLSAVRTMEAFHFVSYVPVNGRLFELDGLKPYPIDHGPWAENEEWTEKFRRVISERLGMATGGVPYHDIRFNLMAVVPDRRQQYEHKLSTLKTNRQIVLEALQQLLDSKMVKVTSPEMEPTSGRGLRSKAEPIVTRSVAAREGIAHPIPGSPPSVRTRHKQKQAAAAAAANNSNNSGSTGSTSSATPSSVGSRATTPSPVLGRLPPGLDCHSYAKSPILKDPNCEDSMSGIKMDGYETDRGESDNEMEADGVSLMTGRGLMAGQETAVNLGEIQGDQLTTVKDNAVKIEISVSDEKEGSFHMPTTVASTDVTKPLTIQTKFTASPGPSSESTDTASEVGSGMNSPVCSTFSGQASPSCPRGKIRGEEAIKAAEGLLLQHKLETGIFGAGIKSEEDRSQDMGSDKLLHGDGSGDSETSPRSKFCSRQGFTPKDLLALLKNVENEISQTEAFLKDECEKRKKYKIDDCRRTHNYDQFVCTFLSMLAEQGHLAGLVEQHTSIKRRTGLSGISHLHKMRKPDKKKRPKPKKKR